MSWLLWFVHMALWVKRSVLVVIGQIPWLSVTYTPAHQNLIAGLVSADPWRSEFILLVFIMSIWTITIWERLNIIAASIVTIRLKGVSFATYFILWQSKMNRKGSKFDHYELPACINHFGPCKRVESVLLEIQVRNIDPFETLGVSPRPP